MPKYFSCFTDTLKYTVKINYGKDAKNKWDVSLVLKICREFDDITSAGKLFHVRAMVLGNAQLPIADSCESGTSSAEVDDDRRRCRPGIPATGWRIRPVQVQRHWYTMMAIT